MIKTGNAPAAGGDGERIERSPREKPSEEDARLGTERGPASGKRERNGASKYEHRKTERDRGRVRAKDAEERQG